MTYAAMIASIFFKGHGDQVKMSFFAQIVSPPKEILFDSKFYSKFKYATNTCTELDNCINFYCNLRTYSH